MLRLLSRRAFIALSVTASTAAGLPHVLSAKPKPTVFTGLVAGVGAGGYDVVQYFDQQKPVKGNPAFMATHDGAAWHFVSAESRDKFLADPARYAPQFGGYCAWAVAEGYTAKGDPNAWSLVDGKLYLNYDASVRRTWEKNTAQNISRGNANWPKVLGR
jgi:hypothetical protein